MRRFPGFDIPRENWSKLPHTLVGALPLIETVSELKVILYILRHTWGYQDSRKRITLDEFADGRKNKDRERLDAGTGLTIPSIRDGLRRAESHGFIIVETDDQDKARVKKFYSLAMVGEKVLHPDCKSIVPEVQESCNRSEKDTIERNQEKETTAAEAAAPPSSFRQWQDIIKETKNRPAALRQMFQILYPDHDLPAFGYIGTTARKVGGAGRLAELLWQISTRPPTGDVLAYALVIAKNGGSNGGNRRRSSKRTGRWTSEEIAAANAEA